jgi:PadR family transcriptional regulator, regulatory protein PadR
LYADLRILGHMEKAPLDLVRGTLDLLILKTLSWGRLHGYDIAAAIRRQTDQALLVEDGALYPALHRMEAKGWIAPDWGITEKNRRAKYYRLTPDGRKHLKREAETWHEYAAAVAKLLSATGKPVGEAT